MADRLRDLEYTLLLALLRLGANPGRRSLWRADPGRNRRTHGSRSLPGRPLHDAGSAGGQRLHRDTDGRADCGARWPTQEDVPLDPGRESRPLTDLGLPAPDDRGIGVSARGNASGGGARSWLNATPNGHRSSAGRCSAGSPGRCSPEMREKRCSATSKRTSVTAPRPTGVASRRGNTGATPCAPPGRCSYGRLAAKALPHDLETPW